MSRRKENQRGSIKNMIADALGKGLVHFVHLYNRRGLAICDSAVEPDAAVLSHMLPI